MQIYIGLIVKEQIINKERFSNTIKEVGHFLQAHNTEIELQIKENLISFKPLMGSLEICFSVNNEHFHTSYYRIHYNDQPSEQTKKFCQIGWECLSIFKENFPSKIELFQQNISYCLDYDDKLFNLEIQRRQQNFYVGRLQQKENLKKDEVQDLLTYIESCSAELNFKGTKTGLVVLNSELCAPCYLLSIVLQQKDLISNLLSLEYQESMDFHENIQNYKEFQETQKQSVILLKKLNNLGSMNNLAQNEVNLMSQNGNNNDIAKAPQQRQLCPTELRQFDEPQNLRVFIFQLKESQDIERVTFILNNVTSKNLDKLEMLNSFRLDEVVNQVMEKYCEGLFGIDASYLTQFLIFHNRLLKYLLASFQQNQEIQKFFLTNQFFIKFNQILQEGVLNILQNQIQLQLQEQDEKIRFLRLSSQFLQYLYNQELEAKDEFLEGVYGCISLIQQYLGKNNENQDQLGENITQFFDSLKILLVQKKQSTQKNDFQNKENIFSSKNQLNLQSQFGIDQKSIRFETNRQSSIESRKSEFQIKLSTPREQFKQKYMTGNDLIQTLRNIQHK